MTKILIFGGFGFLGKSLNKILEQQNSYTVFNESRRTGCDVTDLQQVRQKIQDLKPDIIIFASAHVGSLNYVSENAGDVISDNIQMYTNLYKAVSEINSDIIIVNPLANCSYPGKASVQNEAEWWDGEVHESVQAYGVSQKAAFVISECYKKQYGVQTVNVILPGLYGEGDHLNSERTHAMSGIILRMLDAKENEDKEFVVWGTGKPIREWMFVHDASRLMIQIIDQEKYDLPNPINFGKESGQSISAIAHEVKEIIGYQGDIIYDTSKQDGAPVKLLGASLFKRYFPDFEFTNFRVAVGNSVQYYREMYKLGRVKR